MGPNAVLVLAGSRGQLSRFDELCGGGAATSAPVIIIGGGGVGQATARALSRRSIDYRVVEQERELILDPATYVLGSAADPSTLDEAGIKETSAVIITTNDDDTNIYLTIYCRRVRPDVQIISRATLERNVRTLHRAGSDFVISYASLGANTLFNLLKRTDILMVAEGLNVFKVNVPDSLAGKTIAGTSIRHETGCSIVAVDAGEGGTTINPAPDAVLAEGSEIVLIGTVEAENRFLRTYAKK